MLELLKLWSTIHYCPDNHSFARSNDPRESWSWEQSMRRPWVFYFCEFFCRPSVSSQDSTIQGFLGENVTLPCIFDQNLPKEVNVFWTDQSNDRTVLYIIQNKPDFSSQDKKYKGRVSSSMEDYKKGNFSITMTRLRLDDADTYECTISLVHFKTKVTLKVSGQFNTSEVKALKQSTSLCKVVWHIYCYHLGIDVRNYSSWSVGETTPKWLLFIIFSDFYQHSAVFAAVHVAPLDKSHQSKYV